MPTPLRTPKGINAKLDGNNVVVTWNKPKSVTTAPVFNFRFVKKGDHEEVLGDVITATPEIDAAKKEYRYSIPSPKGKTVLDDYVVQVQEKAAATDTEHTDSEWGTQNIWVINPTLTITIGGHSYTLSRDSFSGGVYKLPISEDEPLEITYADLQEFATSLKMDLPDDLPLVSTSKLQIFEFIVDTDNKLFSIVLAMVFKQELFAGLTIDKIGLTLKRTDGSL